MLKNLGIFCLLATAVTHAYLNGDVACILNTFLIFKTYYVENVVQT